MGGFPDFLSGLAGGAQAVSEDIFNRRIEEENRRQERREDAAVIAKERALEERSRKSSERAFANQLKLEDRQHDRTTKLGLFEDDVKQAAEMLSRGVSKKDADAIIGGVKGKFPGLFNPVHEVALRDDAKQGSKAKRKENELDRLNVQEERAALDLPTDPIPRGRRALREAQETAGIATSRAAGRTSRANVARLERGTEAQILSAESLMGQRGRPSVSAATDTAFQVFKRVDDQFQKITSDRGEQVLFQMAATARGEDPEEALQALEEERNKARDAFIEVSRQERQSALGGLNAGFDAGSSALFRLPDDLQGEAINVAGRGPEELAAVLDLIPDPDERNNFRDAVREIESARQ